MKLNNCTWFAVFDDHYKRESLSRLYTFVTLLTQYSHSHCGTIYIYWENTGKTTVW